MKCKQILDVDGMFDSIFPQLEKWLNEDEKRQEAIIYVAKFKKMDRYNSMIDFLVCEFFGNPYRDLCFQFYKGQAKSLKEIVTKENQRGMEQGLLLLVFHIYRIFEEKRKMKWNDAVGEVINFIKKLIYHTEHKEKNISKQNEEILKKYKSIK